MQLGGISGVGVHYGVTFNFGSVHLPYFLITKIAATDYYMYFYLIVLFPLKAVLQLIYFTAS